MAATGLWVKVAATLPRHYKTEQLAKSLELPIHEVVGKLVSLWIYAVEFANTGLLTMDDIRRGFFGVDEPQDYKSIMTVIQALVDCGMPHHAGFLEPAGVPDDEQDGTTQTWELHDWCEYSGTYQPGMSRNDSGELEFRSSYKKRKKKTLKDEENEQKKAGNTPDRTGADAAGSNSKAGSENTRYELPTVHHDLVSNQGYNFSNARAALERNLTSLREAMERRAASSTTDSHA